MPKLELRSRLLHQHQLSLLPGIQLSTRIGNEHNDGTAETARQRAGAPLVLSNQSFEEVFKTLDWLAVRSRV